MRLSPGRAGAAWAATRSSTCARPAGSTRVRTARWRRSTSAPTCACAATGRSATLHTERSYFPSSDPGLGAVSRYFEGEATSEVGLRAGLRRDLWTAVAPDTAALRRHDRARRPRVRAGHALPRRGARGGARRDAAPPRRALPGETRRRPRFRVLVSPLVTWIWLGALIVFGGGLIAHLAGAGGRHAPVTAGPGRAARARARPRLTARRSRAADGRAARARRGGGSGAPDRRAAARGRDAAEERRAAPRRAELEAAKEAKYREIRDAELDYRTGKLVARGLAARWTRGCAPRRSSCCAGWTRWTPRTAELGRRA